MLQGDTDLFNPLVPKAHNFNFATKIRLAKKRPKEIYTIFTRESMTPSHLAVSKIFRIRIGRCTASYLIYQWAVTARDEWDRDRWPMQWQNKDNFASPHVSDVTARFRNSSRSLSRYFRHASKKVSWSSSGSASSFYRPCTALHWDTTQLSPSSLSVYSQLDVVPPAESVQQAKVVSVLYLRLMIDLSPLVHL